MTEWVKVDPESIKVGDRLRQEVTDRPEARLFGFAVDAVEFVVTSPSEGLPFGSLNSKIFRAIPELPTRPYSLVVPPASERDSKRPFVLDPTWEGPRWYKGSDLHEASAVIRAIRDGWSVIDGPEVSE